MWCEWWILGGGLSEGDNRLTNRHKRKGNKDGGDLSGSLRHESISLFVLL